MYSLPPLRIDPEIYGQVEEHEMAVPELTRDEGVKRRQVFDARACILAEPVNG